MDGHLADEDMPRWWLYADGVWAAAFVGAGLAALRSEMMSCLIDFGLLFFMVLSRLLLVNVGGKDGGFLSLFEFPVVLYLAVHAGVTIFRVRWQRRYGTT